MNILFVCSRNQWRSPTAEAIYRNTNGLNVRSAGTASSARRKITEKDILWADMIFVMEKKHKQIISEHYPAISGDKNIIILDIQDEYNYMDEELIELIRSSVDSYLL